jgi:two-component system NtrC family sensor kinase
MVTGISSRLILVIAAISIATIGIFSYLLTDSQHRALVSQVEHNAHQISETIKSSTYHDMLLNRRESLHRMIDTFGKQEGIEQVRIFNKDGTIIYAADGADVGTMVDKRAEACYACHAADRPLEALPVDERGRVFQVEGAPRQYGIINPIYNEASCWQASCHVHTADQTVLGVLDITMSLEDVDRQLLSSWVKVVAFAATAVLVLSLIIWWFFENLVGKPVSRLVAATQRVAGGDLHCKVDVKRRDELGRLADSFNDMTAKLREQHQQLIQSDKLASLGRLAAGVAHEINNPLTGVLTYSSFLLKRAEDAETREDLEIVVRETKRCRQIVKNLLDFARQAHPKKSEVDLEAVVRRALGILRNRLEIEGVSVEVDIAADLPPIRADRDQLVQVLINLVVNAADALGTAGGTINIRAAADAAGVALEVSDSGCGIEPEHVNKIFDPFFSTKGHEGTGLGLAVVWGIVNEHGGEIEVASEPGKGTTISIRLPAPPGAPLVARACA